MHLYFFAFLVAKRPSKTGSGRSLKDLQLNGIRNADMAAVSVAIKRRMAHRGYKSNAAFAARWDDPCRGRPPSGPGARHTLRDTGSRCLPPSGWGALRRGGNAGRPRRRQPRPAIPGGATIRRSYPFFGVELIYWHDGTETPIQSCPCCRGFNEVGRPEERNGQGVGTRLKDRR